MVVGLVVMRTTKINLQTISEKLKNLINFLETYCEVVFSVVSVILMSMGHKLFGAVILIVTFLNWIKKDNARFYKGIYGERYAEVTVTAVKYRYLLCCIVALCLTAITVYCLSIYKDGLLKILEQGRFSLRGEML